MDLIALLAVDLRRNEHGKVGLAAGGGEGGADILGLAVRVLNAQNEHMFSHPVFLASEVGSNTEGEALLAEQYVSAVAGVDRPDGVVLGEVADVTVLLVKLCFGVQTLYIVGAVADSVKHIVADAGHDEHIENDIDGVGKLDAVFGEFRAYNAHGVGNDVHGASLHRAGVELCELCIAFGGIHPVVDIAGVLFL